MYEWEFEMPMRAIELGAVFDSQKMYEWAFKMLMRAMEPSAVFDSQRI